MLLGAHRDPLSLEDLGKHRAYFRLLEGEQAVERLDDRDAHTEAGERLPDLGPDRAAAEHDQRLG